MIRKMWPGLTALALVTIYGFYVMDRLPARLATHWAINGQPNGWSQRGLALFLLPVIGAVTAIVLYFAPRIDPKRQNFPQHEGSYYLIANALLVFMAAVHLLVIGLGLGWRIDLNLAMGTGLGALFVLLGNVMTRVRPNWVFGVRTPWTLSSDRSWRETHRIAGYGFVVTGLLMVATALIAPSRVVVVMIAGLLINVLLAVVWSYLAWKRDPQAQGREA